jgi:hypothetical protein
MLGSLLSKLPVAGVFCAALLSGLGCGQAPVGPNNPGVSAPVGPSTDGPDPDTPQPKLDVAKTKAAFTMEADSWFDQWRYRETARRKYKGKVVELRGTVDGVGADSECKAGFIYLKGKPDSVGVTCTLDDPAPWLKVGPGCTVKIKGVAGGIGLGDLISCVIVESSPNSCLEISARELAKAFATDKKAAEEKYHSKWVIVQGELSSMEPSEADGGLSICLTLKGDGTAHVKCCVPNQTDEEKQANNSLKVGQKLKVCGRAEIKSDEKYPNINSSSRMVTLVP